MSDPPIFATTSQQQPVGVGGWLMLFCISLTIVSPIAHLNVAVKAMKSLLYPGHIGQITILRLAVVFVVYAGLAIFSVVCGYLLWSENPRGPRVTKAFLLIGAVVAITLNVVLALTGMKIDLLLVVPQRLIYASCWYAYLSTSVRVRNTYGIGPIPVASPSFPAAVSPSGSPAETMPHIERTPNSGL